MLIIKEFIETSELRDASDYCKKVIIAENLMPHQSQQHNQSSDRAVVSLNLEQNGFMRRKAARTIQRFWRASQAKEALVKDSYHFYTSLIDAEEVYQPLSNIMFDLHVAELAFTCQETSKNPLAERTHGYHRQFGASERLLEKLLLSFKIPKEDIEKNTYIPVFVLRNSPIEDINSLVGQNFTLVRSKNHTIALFVMAKDDPDIIKCKRILAATGVYASIWEIAQNIDSSSDAQQLASPPIYCGLPLSRRNLLESRWYKRLESIAENKTFPTYLLAASVCKLIHHASRLSPHALRRIALMLEITVTFYAIDYHKFAFLIYAVVHEISISLIKQSPEEIEQNYEAFARESKSTLLRCLDVREEQLKNHIFFSSPAVSGSNSYVIAMQLARKMRTASGVLPTIKIIKPSYYEFDYITESSTEIDPDIFVLCAGPIVTPSGLVPGIDINRFIKRQILVKPFIKPVTVVIDTTTALYKHLKLDPEVKQLIERGLLSIILHESHQKFGLLHTDQAQYGRTFGLCSKQSFTSSDIDEMGRSSKFDFGQYVDMRIGSFISVCCTDILEAIKIQHFRNATYWLHSSPSIVFGEDSLTNENEMCFVVLPEKNADASLAVELRDSFGHYLTTQSQIGRYLRITPNGSDTIDTLISAAKFFVTQTYSVQKCKEVLINNGNILNPLVLEHQIICLAMLNNLVKYANEYKILLHVFDKLDVVKYTNCKEAVARKKPLKEKYEELYRDSIAKKEVGEVVEESTIKQLLECISELEEEIKESELRITAYEAEPLKNLQLCIAMNKIFKQCSLLKGRAMYMQVGRYLTEFRQELTEEHRPVDPVVFFKAINTLYEKNTTLTYELLNQLKSDPLFCKTLISQASEERGLLRHIGVFAHRGSGAANPDRFGKNSGIGNIFL